MDGKSPETCAECGFDALDWRVPDAGTFFGALGFWWRLALADVSAADLNRRPAPDVWSALEYGFHSAMVTAVLRAGIELILAEDGCVLPPYPNAPPSAGEPADVEAAPILDALEQEGAALAAVSAVRSQPWSNTGQLGDTIVQAEAALFHAVHDASHHFMDIARGLSSIGAGTPRGAGTVAQINASGGGVPKLPVAQGQLERRGLDGDVQADQKHHGRPFQAVCLWSADVIDELAANNHPIAAGSAGENVTVRGVDWAAMRPGTRLRVGTALVELSYPAVPCKKQTRWFADGDFTRIAHENNPQWVRWYGWVREPGDVRSGDEVVVQPPA